MERSENQPRFIFPVASVLSLHGFGAADDEWMPSIHINTPTVSNQSSTQKRNVKVV
jgi:hypothetical protein